MSTTLTITEKVNIPGVSIEKQNAFSESDERANNVSAAIADSTTDGLVNCAIDQSQLKAIYIVSDQDLTLETNDGTTPTDTIALKAGIPYLWYTSKYEACLITADVTALYLTNASGATANFNLISMEDSTP